MQKIDLAYFNFSYYKQIMDQVCEKLDDLSIRNLELCNDFIKLKLDLENRMKDGWMHLAKSRYLMGYNNVSGLQIDERNTTALAHVEATEPKGQPLKVEVRLNDDKEKLRELSKIFGVLTPSNVKSAQVQFSKCLELIGELVSIKEEMKYVEDEYEKYSKQKQSLVQNEQ